jgi:lactate 2-monooxygenase
MARYGLDRQLEIYQAGGTLDAVTADDWARQAEAALPPGPWGYVAGGAGTEATIRSNRAAFDRWRIVPRQLRGVSDRDLATTVLGTAFPVPFALAPVGVQSVVHAQAERVPAAAAAALRVPLILSTVSSVALEEVGAIMGDAPRWFQLYPGTDPEIVASLIARAERAGYSALVVTVDTTMLAWRPRDLRTGYLPFFTGQGIANYTSDPVFQSRLGGGDLRAAVELFLRVYTNPGFTWADLDRIRAATRVPLLVKGLLHPDDARQAVAHGADGIVVSNHGGRQVDGSIAALDALPAIAAAVDVPVLMDSGIRCGADVVKALALGAKAVLIGRPYVYAMAVAGQAGVDQVLRDLRAEVDLTLAMAGLRSVAEVTREAVSAPA